MQYSNIALPYYYIKVYAVYQYCPPILLYYIKVYALYWYCPPMPLPTTIRYKQYVNIALPYCYIHLRICSIVILPSHITTYYIEVYAVYQYCPPILLHTLTHWGRDKMAAISQTTLSNSFSWMKMLEFRLKFHWSLFPRVQLTIFQHWFRWWLCADQATSHYLNQWWLDHRRIYASLGLNELRYMQYINIALPYRYILH